MEVQQIIDILIARLNELGLWFTAKTDPTYMEPSSYYELDQYGDPTEKAKKKLAKEIESFIGDGAVTIEDAVELWISNAGMEFSIAFKECIVTKYEPKPVVPGLDAYENSVQLAGSEKSVKTENVERNMFYYEIYFDFSSESGKEGRDGFSMFFKSTENVTDYDDILNLAEKLGKFDEYDVTRYDMDFCQYAQQISEDEYNSAVGEETDNKEIKTENVKRRLEEENNRSSDVITAKMQDPDFDAESADGKIVLKTSELFNKLTDKGYNVQVSFDNGESQSTILFGQTGANATITITNNNDPIKAFVSGNFLLDTDIVNQLSDLEKDINI